MRGIIYKATFPSGKAYIGQTTKSLGKRKRQHVRKALSGSPFPFHAAIRKYGAENVKWEIIARAAKTRAINLSTKQKEQEND